VGKNSLFDKWCWDNWITIYKILRLDPIFTPYTKINSEWIKGINLRAKTIKLLEENVGINLCDPGLGNSFLNMKPKT